MSALSAALIMVHHDALADFRRGGKHARADGGDHAARFVAADGRIRIGWQTGGIARLGPGPAILVQVGPAHAGGFHLDDDLAKARRWVGKRHQFQLAITGEYDALHDFLRLSAFNAM